MALKKDVILNLNITNKEAVNNIAELTKKLDELKVKRLGLNAAVKNNIITEDEYYKQLAKVDAQIKETNTALKAYQKELSQNIAAENTNTGSIEQMRAQLALLTKQYDALSQQDREAIGGIGEKTLLEIRQLTEELTQAEQASGRFQRAVGSYEDAIKNALSGTIPMKQALTGIKSDLQTLTLQYRQTATEIAKQREVVANLAATQGVESEEYKQAKENLDQLEQAYVTTGEQIQTMTQAAGELQDAMSDASKSIKNAATDAAALKGLTEGITLMANGYTVLKSSMTVLGIESEELMNVFAKLQIIQQGVNAVNQIANSLQKESVLRQQLAIFWNKLRGKSIQEVTTAQVAENAATTTGTAATTAFTAAEGAATAASTGLAGAIHAVGAAIKSIPVIGWILAAVSALVTLISLIRLSNKEEEEGKKLSNDILNADKERVAELDKIVQRHKQISQNLKKEADSLAMMNPDSRLYKDTIKEIADYIGVSVEYAEKHKDELRVIINAQNELNALQEQYDKNSQDMLETDARRNKLIVDTKDILRQSYDASEQSLKAMVDGNRITEGQMKDIAKIRKQLIKEEISEEEAYNSIKVVLSEQLGVWSKIYVEEMNTNNELAKKLKLQKEIVDVYHNESDELDAINKAAESANERRRNEVSETRKRQDMELQMLKEGIERQLREYRLASQRQVEDLKERLRTEKNLTAKAREEINRQITLTQAKAVTGEYEIRQKYTEDYLKKELAVWKAYYKSVQNAMPKSGQALEASLKTLEITFKSSVDELQKQMEPLNSEYIEWERMSLTVGEERKRMLEEMGMTEEEFAKQHAIIVNRWTEQSKVFGDTMKNMETDFNNEAIRIRAKFDEERRKTMQDTVDVRNQELFDKRIADTELSNYTDKEVRKTEIMREQAQERVLAATNEAKRLAELSDEEITAIYGTDEAYQLVLAKAQAKVTEEQINLQKAIRQTNDALQQQKDKMLQTGMAIADSMAGVAGTLSDLFNTLAQDNEQYADFATGMAMAQIMISSAIAIAQAIQAAVQAGGFTGPAAAVTIPVFVAEMVGIVASGIASAVSVLKQAQQYQTSAPKFAEGGLVGGKTTYGAEGRRDDMTIMASRGEFVVNADATRKHLKELIAINGGIGDGGMFYATGGVVSGSYTKAYSEQANVEQMREAFADVIADITPVVSVKEITRMQNRVKVKSTIAAQ